MGAFWQALGFTVLLATAYMYRVQHYRDGTIGRPACLVSYYTNKCGTAKQYYLSGKLYSSSTFDRIRKTIAHGTLNTWYESGQLHYQATCIHNAPVEAFGYYPTGQLKRHELYVDKKRKVAQCFAEDGHKLRFFAFSIMPVYPEGNGGEHALIVAVMHNTFEVV